MTDDELRAAYMAGAPGALAWPWPEGLRAVLAAFGAQQAGEPVAYRHMHDDGWEYYDAPTGSGCEGCQPLYTASPAAARVPLTADRMHAGLVDIPAMQAAARRPLTDDQLRSLWMAAEPTIDGKHSMAWVFARSIERAHGITAAGQEGGAA